MRSDQQVATAAPADGRIRRALEALSPQAERYRAAVGRARDAMREHLASRRAQSDGGAARAALELGRFADGRVDSGRFAALFTGAQILEADAAERIGRCASVLDDLLERGDALFVHDLPSGGDVRRTIDAALADAGRLFGAVLAFQALRGGAYRAEEHEAGLGAFPYGRWNRGERLLAPPLVIAVDGADLDAASAAGVLDGGARLVFVVRGASTPAPLLRLVTPGTLVLQAADAEALVALRDFDGPAVAALLPDGAARFAHDPRAGRTLAERLVVSHLPDAAPRRAIGGRSTWQQREELAQLAELSRLGAIARDAPADSSVDALASWLVAQTGLGAAGVGARAP
ncbi:MAG TPA: hypothetical protein VFZ11_05900 [Gemmatimonadaceae bacterium]